MALVGLIGTLVQAKVRFALLSSQEVDYCGRTEVGQTWVVSLLSNSCIRIMMRLYMVFCMISIIDGYWVGAVPKVKAKNRLEHAPYTRPRSSSKKTCRI